MVTDKIRKFAETTFIQSDSIHNNLKNVVNNIEMITNESLIDVKKELGKFKMHEKLYYI